jgi:hypothetical protein
MMRISLAFDIRAPHRPRGLRWRRAPAIAAGLSALAAAPVIAVLALWPPEISSAPDQGPASQALQTAARPAPEPVLTLEEARARWYELVYAGRTWDVPEWLLQQGPRHPEP